VEPSAVGDIEDLRPGRSNPSIGRPRFIDRIDAEAGARIENAVCSHHSRRLLRAGRSAQLDPAPDGRLWAAAEPPVRDGCALEVLIDGAEALPRIAEALATARSFVHIAGWHVTPDFGLTRDESALPLRTLLGRLADRVDVRVLLWAGAPVPVFAPRRNLVRQVRDDLTRGTRVRCELDARERPMHCHHEKLVIVDGEVAFVGGIDMTSLAGDRYDSSDHPVRGGLGWHDVATRLRGPAVADVDGHFRSRWREVSGEDLGPAAEPRIIPEGIPIQVVRTVPEKVYDFLPRGDFRILESYVRALREARTFIYLENQFLWSPEVVNILERKLVDPPSAEFRIVAMLPRNPNNGGDDTRGQIARLIAADAGRGRFLAVTTRQRAGSVTGPVYVHAKVGIVDDRWLTIGSANLNEHSLFNDSEMNVVTCDGALARQTRLRLWAEHLERTVDEVSGPPTDVVDELWRPIARREKQLAANGEPAQHRLLELPGVSRRSMALLGPLQGFVVDG
jgi:phosphatidylserine/phosphatidylglycerophosphate/cardiolipin synthase-like enzyme